MANATARVKKGTVRIQDEFLEHSYGTISSATQLYTNAMIGLNAGYLAKFDDTASMKFMGVVRGREGDPIIPTDGSTSGTAGDAKLFVGLHQPKAFELTITSVAITDIGRRVYALDDQTGTLDPSATTYANLIGVVKDLVFSTTNTPVSNIALVTPIYDVPNGSQMQVAAASGAVQIKPGVVVITKGSAAALTMADPTSGVHDGMVMFFISQTAAAHTLVIPSGFNQSGTTGTWGGARGDNITLIAYGGKWYVDSKTNVTLT